MKNKLKQHAQPIAKISGIYKNDKKRNFLQKNDKKVSKLAFRKCEKTWVKMYKKEKKTWIFRHFNGK